MPFAATPCLTLLPKVENRYFLGTRPIEPYLFSPGTQTTNFAFDWIQMSQRQHRLLSV